MYDIAKLCSTAKILPELCLSNREATIFQVFNEIFRDYLKIFKLLFPTLFLRCLFQTFLFQAKTLLKINNM